MGWYHEELVQAGIMRAGEGLKPSAQGKRVRFSGPNWTAVDGPFPATGALVAGFRLRPVRSMDEAVGSGRSCRACPTRGQATRASHVGAGASAGRVAPAFRRSPAV